MNDNREFLHLTEEEYQRRIDADLSIKRLSQRTVREREKDLMPPEERNPRGAGRKRMPDTERHPSVAMRVPCQLSEDVRKIVELYRKDPERVKHQVDKLINTFSL